MDRYIQSFIEKDLSKKMVLVAGPRQCGKTTLARLIAAKKDSLYLNWDSLDHRKIILSRSWNKEKKLWVFDEIHKMRKWKAWLKGIYDTKPIGCQILVTGSARLETFRKGGDSLAGRYYAYRLYPLSVSEMKEQLTPTEALNRILIQSSFPEPFFESNEIAAKRWRKTYAEKILKEDLYDLSVVKEVDKIEVLLELLADRVGSGISFKSLGEDLQVSPHTIKHWVQLLEALFLIFIVRPYSKRLTRALQKEPKIYFYDTGKIKDPGAKIENAVACALLKRNHFLEDTLGETRGLHYVKDLEKREVDFVTTVEDQIEWLIEIKLRDTAMHGPLSYYTERLKPKQSFQIVYQLNDELDYGKIKVRKMSDWLEKLEA